MSDFHHRLKVTAVLAAGLLGGSCARVETSLLNRGMNVAANDRIMLVRKDPPSFGHQRLAMQSQVYPDLGMFIAKFGMPDFLAETANQQRHYFILYFLKRREAYACRIRAGSQAVEFAGPYPITPREYRLLDGFRKDPAHAPTRL